MKVYIAARYSRKTEIEAAALQLAADGFDVVSTWHLEAHIPTTQLSQVPAEQLRQYAARDLSELAEADVLVLFTDSDQFLSRRNGHNVEFGFALAQGKPVAAIGPIENIFHFIDRVEHYQSLEHFTKENNQPCPSPIS